MHLDRGRHKICDVLRREEWNLRTLEMSCYYSTALVTMWSNWLTWWPGPWTVVGWSCLTWRANCLVVVFAFPSLPWNGLRFSPSLKMRRSSQSSWGRQSMWCRPPFRLSRCRLKIDFSIWFFLCTASKGLGTRIQRFWHPSPCVTLWHKEVFAQGDTKNAKNKFNTANSKFTRWDTATSLWHRKSYYSQGIKMTDPTCLLKRTLVVDNGELFFNLTKGAKFTK